jgi:hypothetical protein
VPAELSVLIPRQPEAPIEPDCDLHVTILPESSQPGVIVSVSPRNPVS